MQVRYMILYFSIHTPNNFILHIQCIYVCVCVCVYIYIYIYIYMVGAE